MPFYRHTFDSIDFGGIHFNQTEFGVAQDQRNWILKNAVHDPSNPLGHDETVNAPVTLGMSHLEKLRLYFSFGERTLYVTRADASL